MKIRNGYVSNSSSSSFVCIGKKITSPTKALKEGKKVLVYIEGVGTSGEAADWAMYIDNEILSILQASKWFSQMRHVQYWEVHDGIRIEYDRNTGEDIMIVDDDISGETVFSFRRDYSSPNNKKQLLEFLEDRR